MDKEYIKEYINDLERITVQMHKNIKKLTEAKEEFIKILEEMAEDSNLVQCKVCGQYEYENLVDCRKYNEEICKDCEERGYGEYNDGWDESEWEEHEFLN